MIPKRRGTKRLLTVMAVSVVLVLFAKYLNPRRRSLEFGLAPLDEWRVGRSAITVGSALTYGSATGVVYQAGPITLTKLKWKRLG